MTNEPEWRDANPKTNNLSGRGRIIIQCVASGIALFAITFVGMKFKPVALSVGGFSFLSGLIMLVRRKNLFYKPGLIVASCGFLLLLSYPSIGIVTAISGYLLIVAAIGLIVFGLFKAIKLAWDVKK